MRVFWNTRNIVINNNYKLKRFVFLQHLYSLATKILTINDKHQSLNLFVTPQVSLNYLCTKFCWQSYIIRLNHNFCWFDHRFLKYTNYTHNTPFSNWTMNWTLYKNSQRCKIWFDGSPHLLYGMINIYFSKIRGLSLYMLVN